MSAVATPVVRPLRPQSDSSIERRLRVVERPARRRPRLLYGLIAVATALSIAGAQMGLSIAMMQGTYEVRALTSQAQQLGWERQSAVDALAGLSSPQYLAANAAALGMVINEAPSYLRLSDSHVLGVGASAAIGSNVDALARGSVANALVAGAPLVTDPSATLEGRPVDTTTSATPTGETPPALESGLPSPSTH